MNDEVFLNIFGNYTLKENTTYFNYTTDLVDNNTFSCQAPNVNLYNNSFGFETAVPQWEALASVLILSTVIIGTIFGNILVILGVFTHKPLRIVQNFFIVSLAVADLAVAILVLPFNVAYATLGRWVWGKHLCKMWLTSDILCCTSSILNLCAIAIDRYWAITDPINYAHKRTLKRVLFQIAGVWILSLIISSPPVLGWNDWPDEFTVDTQCQLTSEPGYVVYSSLGSFFIPLFIMTIVYLKIYIAAKKRFRRRNLAARIYRKRPVIKDEKLENSLEQKEVSENDSESEESIQRKFTEIKRNLFVPLLMLNDAMSRFKVESNNSRPVSPTGSIKRNVVGSIRRVSQRRKKNEKPLLASVTNSGDVVHQFIEQKQKISLSKERRAARTLGIIMGVFVVCWLPFFLMYIILPFCPICCPTTRVINFITWLGYVNSTVNPLIYTIFNLDFRKAFKKLLYLDK